MEKILKKLCVFWTIFLLTFIMNGKVYAEHEHKAEQPPIYQTPGLVKKPVPVYCGPTDKMFDAATKGFNQKPLVASSVIIPSTGEVVAVLTIFVNNDEKTDMSVLMTMITRNETCVLGYGKDLKFYEGEQT